jgi:hypothetical protein
MSIVKEIVIDTSAILTTLKCNLRCKLCCTSTPYQENPAHFPLERLNAIISQYFKVVKFIRKLSFGGGEPMLRTDMASLIEATVKHQEQFDIFEIITNGTIIPMKEILDTIEKYKDKMYIMIDHYGSISKNASGLADILQNRGIKHSIRIYHGENAHMGGWVDLGDFFHKHTPDKAKAIYMECCIPQKLKRRTGSFVPIEGYSESTVIPYMACTDGLLHRCARAYATMQAGSISDNDRDFVNIMDDSKTLKQIRDEVYGLFLMDYPKACEYCNGFSSESKRYMPAEQLV